MRSLFAAVFAVATLAASGPAVSQTTDEDTKVVARIDGEPIHMNRMRQAMQNFGRDLQQLSPQAFYSTVLDRLIDQQLAAGAAEAEGLADDPEVQARLAELRANILAGAYLRRIGAAAIEEDALRARYAEIEAEGIKKVRARHILVQTEEKGYEMIAALGGGADFAELAQQHSVGPSGKTGGDLGFFVYEQMVKPFADAAFGMEPGQFSDAPVQTQFGWHVIQVEEISSDPAPPYETMKPKLSEQAQTEAMVDALEGLRNAVKIEKFDPDGAPIE